MGVVRKKVIYIIPPIEFRDEEFFESKAILEDAGFYARVATVDNANVDECIGMLRQKVKFDFRLSGLISTDWDAFVVIGGNGAVSLYNDVYLHKLLFEAYTLNRVIGATGNGVMALANAGILHGIRVTGNKNDMYSLESKGAVFTGRRVEYCGKIITSSVPDASMQFGRSLVKELMVTE